MDGFVCDDRRTMLPGLMISLKSDIMDCKVAWCRFATSKRENLARKNHKHVIYEMHFILDGKILYNMPRLGLYSAKKGEFMLIPQGMMHATSDGDVGCTEYLVIAFSPSSTNSAINAIFSPENEPLVMRYSDTTESMINSLKLKTQNKNFSTGLSTKLIIHSILLEAVDSIVDKLGLSCLSERLVTQNDPRVNSIVQQVNDNIYNQKMRGEEIAAQLNITTRQLNRICNQYFGCPINQYITQTRIRGMKTLLRESSYTLSDISEIFGFSDVYAFIKHFTHFTGITPGNYRKNNQI